MDSESPGHTYSCSANRNGVTNPKSLAESGKTYRPPPLHEPRTSSRAMTSTRANRPMDGPHFLWTFSYLPHHKGPLALDPPCSGGPLFETMANPTTRTVGAHQWRVDESECGTMQSLILTPRPKPAPSMTLNQTPPPTPNWTRHLETESRLMLELRGGMPTVVNRDCGDETDDELLNDGLEVME